jgi:hypothetical protein
MKKGKIIVNVGFCFLALAVIVMFIPHGVAFAAAFGFVGFFVVVIGRMIET